MANQQANTPGIVVIMGVLFVLAVIMSLFSSNNTSTTTTTYTPSRDSFEHRYVTERFKREGLKKSEAQQAADAVMRFHEAQKNR